MIIEDRIEQLLEEPLRDMGYNIVRIQVRGEQRKTLELMIEKMDETSISIEDCVVVSKEASILLDVEEPIRSAYVLEVSSPGIDRPLVKKRDFVRFAGSQVKVQTYHPIDKRKRFQGILTSVLNDELILEARDESDTVKTVHIPLDNIQKAKLVPTE